MSNHPIFNLYKMSKQDLLFYINNTKNTNEINIYKQRLHQIQETNILYDKINKQNKIIYNLEQQLNNYKQNFDQPFNQRFNQKFNQPFNQRFNQRFDQRFNLQDNNKNLDNNNIINKLNRINYLLNKNHLSNNLEKDE